MTNITACCAIVKTVSPLDMTNPTAYCDQVIKRDYTKKQQRVVKELSESFTSVILI